MADHIPLQQPLGLILAGGQSSRMGGGDKVLLRLKDGSVLDEVISRFSPQVQDIALSVHRQNARYPAAISTVLADESDEYQGPLAGVRSGLRWLDRIDGDWLVTIAGDTPFLPPDLVPRLLDAALSGSAPAAIAKDEDGFHPTAALWHRDLLPLVEERLARNELRLRDALLAANAKTAEFPGSGGFFNINTPEDLTEARRRAYIPKA